MRVLLKDGPCDGLYATTEDDGVSQEIGINNEVHKSSDTEVDGIRVYKYDQEATRRRKTRVISK